MADMYGAIKSNHFRVRDAVAFKEWFSRYTFGEGVEVWIDPATTVVETDGMTDEQFQVALGVALDDMVGPDTRSNDVSFGGYVQYPTAYPQVYNDVDEDPDADPIEEADLDVFADELRQHLMPGEIFYVIASGAEMLRYVAFSELAITHEHLAFRSAISDDNESGWSLIALCPSPPEPTVGPKVNDPPHRTLDLGDG